MNHLARLVFWWLAVPLLAITLLGAISYVHAPTSLPPAGAADSPSLKDVLTSLRSMFVPLAGTTATPTVRADNTDPVPILMYHFVRDNVNQATDPLGYGLSVPTREFAQQMQYLADNGYTTVTMDAVARGEYGAKSVALTFDDGYKDFITDAYPILEQHNFTATVFIITSRLNDTRHLSPDDIVYLANRGIAFGSHSVSHLNLANQSATNLHTELADSQKTLVALLNKPITAVSYPAGKYSAAVVSEATKLGYTSGVTVEEGRADPSKDMMRLARIRMKRSITPQGLGQLMTQSPVIVGPTDTNRAPSS